MKPQKRTMNSVETATRRLEDLGIGRSGGDGTWTTVDEWFDSDNIEFSMEFRMVESFEYQDDSKRPKFGFGLMVENDDTKYYVAFPAANNKGEVVADRKKLFDALQDDNTPISGCVMQRIDTGKDKPFIKIISVEQMERILAAEGNEDELGF